MNLEDLHYTPSHEWVRIDGGLGTIGITDHTQKELGEIVYLELPELGRSRRSPSSTHRSPERDSLPTKRWVS